MTPVIETPGTLNGVDLSSLLRLDSVLRTPAPEPAAPQHQAGGGQGRGRCIPAALGSVPAGTRLFDRMVAMEPGGLLIWLQPVVGGRPVKWAIRLFILKQSADRLIASWGLLLGWRISTPDGVGFAFWPVPAVAGGGAVIVATLVAGNSSQWSSRLAGGWTSQLQPYRDWFNHSDRSCREAAFVRPLEALGIDQKLAVAGPFFDPVVCLILKATQTLKHAALTRACCSWDHVAPSAGLPLVN